MFIPTTSREVHFSARTFLDQVLPELLRQYGQGPAKTIGFRLGGPEKGRWTVRLSDGQTMPHAKPDLLVRMQSPLFCRLIREAVDVPAEESAGHIIFEGERRLMRVIGDAIAAAVARVESTPQRKSLSTGEPIGSSTPWSVRSKAERRLPTQRRE